MKFQIVGMLAANIVAATSDGRRPASLVSTFLPTFTYKGVTGANLGALFFSKNWMEIQHGGANKVANDVVE